MTARPQSIGGSGGGGGFSSVIYRTRFPVMPRAYLRLGQAQSAGELLPLGSHHVVVLLEGPFQPEQLRGRERRPDAFGLPGEGAVKEKVLRAVVLAWKPQRRRSSVINFTLNFRFPPLGV